jgi:hypothetical protein
MAAEGKKRKNKKNGISLSSVFWAAALVVMAGSVAVRLFGSGAEDIQLPEKGSYHLEVLNGSGEKNLVKRTTRQLRRIGIDVLVEGNAESFDFERSVIIDRKGNRELAELVAERLGCEVVIQQLQEKPKVDLTFIVGNDNEELNIDIQEDN